MKRTLTYISGFLVLIFISCSRFPSEDCYREHIKLYGTICQTRANDSKFEDGDQIGIYVVDYNGEAANALLNQGNRADNVMFSYNKGLDKWNPEHPIYWKDKQTNIDIYGYYPYRLPFNVNPYSFILETDQSESVTDFLWGKATNITFSGSVIGIEFNHVLSSMMIRLVEGTGFESGEWESLSKSVKVTNVKVGAKVNLSDGTVSATGTPTSEWITPKYSEGCYKAIIVPQEVGAGVELVSITIGELTYIHTIDSDFTFEPLKQHLFTFTINKRKSELEVGVERFDTEKWEW